MKLILKIIIKIRLTVNKNSKFTLTNNKVYQNKFYTKQIINGL